MSYSVLLTGWKSKRSLRGGGGGELDEMKLRKGGGGGKEGDRGLGSQGFVYVMANKQPLWNEATQVYQLDFGGRVTQESAKNFQIELEGRQVRKHRHHIGTRLDSYPSLSLSL